jgi:hypothetical protein
MDVRIEANEQEQSCKVWINDTPVTFANVEEAQAYVDQLKARISASPLTSHGE